MATRERALGNNQLHRTQAIAACLEALIVRNRRMRAKIASGRLTATEGEAITLRNEVDLLNATRALEQMGGARVEVE